MKLKILLATRDAILEATLESVVLPLIHDGAERQKVREAISAGINVGAERWEGRTLDTMFSSDTADKLRAKLDILDIEP